MTTSKSECKQYFGYLNVRPKGDELPEECITCLKALECMRHKPENAGALNEERQNTPLCTDNLTAEKKEEKHTPQHNEEEEQTSPNAFQIAYARLRSFLSRN